MKKVFLALTLALTLGATQVSWASSAPKHRYTPTTQVEDKTTQAAKQKATPAEDDAVEAYSDTTSVDTSATQVDSDDDARASRSHSIYSLENYDDPFDFFGSIFGKSTLFFVMFLMLLIGLIFVFAPLIIIFLILRYLYRRHQDRMKLMEMAMEKGGDVPESERPIDKQRDDYLIKRGLRNFFLGAGLVAMFAIWDWDFMTGIGALVCVYGLGQFVIGYIPTFKQNGFHFGNNNQQNASSGDFIKNEQV